LSDAISGEQFLANANCVATDYSVARSTTAQTQLATSTETIQAANARTT